MYVGIYVTTKTKLFDLEIDNKEPPVREQRLINLEIPVLVSSLKSSNVELG